MGAGAADHALENRPNRSPPRWPRWLDGAQPTLIIGLAAEPLIWRGSLSVALGYWSEPSPGHWDARPCGGSRSHPWRRSLSALKVGGTAPCCASRTTVGAANVCLGTLLGT